MGLGSFGYHSFNGHMVGCSSHGNNFSPSVIYCTFRLQFVSVSFMPGYAIAKMLSGKDRNGIATSSLPLVKRLLPRFLVAYFFSMLITGLTVYIIAAEVDFASAQVGEDGVGDFLIHFKA